MGMGEWGLEKARKNTRKIEWILRENKNNDSVRKSERGEEKEAY